MRQPDRLEQLTADIRKHVGPVSKTPVYTHYQMTRQEATKLASDGWIDPQDFAQHPWMLCRTGDGHALGARNKNAVTCPACKELLKQRGLL